MHTSSLKLLSLVATLALLIASLSAPSRADPASEVVGGFTGKADPQLTISRGETDLGWKVGPHSESYEEVTRGTHDFHIGFQRGGGYHVLTPAGKKSVIFPGAAFSHESGLGVDLSESSSVLHFNRKETGAPIAFKVVEFRLDGPGLAVQKKFLRMLITEKGEAVPLGFSPRPMADEVVREGLDRPEIQWGEELKTKLFQWGKLHSGAQFQFWPRRGDWSIALTSDRCARGSAQRLGPEELWTRLESSMGERFNRRAVVNHLSEGFKPNFGSTEWHPTYRSITPQQKNPVQLRSGWLALWGGPQSKMTHQKHAWSEQEGHLKWTVRIKRLQDRASLSAGELRVHDYRIQWTDPVAKDIHAWAESQSRESRERAKIETSKIYFLDLDDAGVGGAPGVYDDLMELQASGESFMLLVREGGEGRMTYITAGSKKALTSFVWPEESTRCVRVLREVLSVRGQEN